MEVGCDLEIDVNGEEIFMVNKKTIASFSGRFNSLFSKMTGSKKCMKVIFRDFPGGAYGFELMARFCYNNGSIEITPSNVVLLNCAAQFMDTGRNSSATLNLAERTEKALEGIIYWTWSELLVALKQCQNLFPAPNSSYVLEKVLDCLIGRLITSPNVTTSPFTSSSGNTSFQYSCDTSSTLSMRYNCSPAGWWFEDLLFLDVGLLDRVIRMMVSQKLDHAIVFKFLIFYLRFRFLSVTLAEKHKIARVVVSVLSLLDRRSLSFKGLFDVFQIISKSKPIIRRFKLTFESLMGSKLDQATLDHLLFPSPYTKRYAYDVNLVLRLAESFLLEGGWRTPNRLKKVGSLLDSYVLEVAPDFLLKPVKFTKLVLVLPDSARESCDKLYQAIDMYLKVHPLVCKEEKAKIYSGLNPEKLSAGCLKHLAMNSKFPSRTAAGFYINQQSKLNSLVHRHFQYLESLSNPLFCRGEKGNMRGQENGKDILLSTRKHAHPTESVNLGALQGMDRKVCRMMQSSKMLDATKPGLRSVGKGRSLPRLC